MAGTVIADYIQAAGSTLSMNVGNTLVLTANASGLTYVPTGNVNINIGSTASLTMGNVTATGTLAAGNTTVTGTLSATGATTLSTTLGVTGAATLSSTLGVTGTSTLRTTSLRDTTPEVNNAYTLGTNALRWGDLRTQVGQCYGLFDVGTADINIGYSKMLSILAPATTAGVLIQVQGSAYPCVANWSYDNTGDNTFQYFYANSAGDLKGNISFNRAAGLTAYSTTSDGTLKNIIGDAPQAKSLSILSNTRLREYSWKDDANNKPQIGVIAQELVNVFSGAVSVGGDVETTDAEGNVTTKYRPWTVDRTAYQFHLVAGWQNHESKIAALEARLAALEAK